MRPQGYTYDRVDRPREAHRALREEHNAVKAFLIEWAASWVRGPKHVVDLACGKGGDVNKWAPHAATYVGVEAITHTPIVLASPYFFGPVIFWPPFVELMDSSFAMAGMNAS